MNEPQRPEATPSNLKTVAFEPPVDDTTRISARLADTHDYLAPARRKHSFVFWGCCLFAVLVTAAALLYFSATRTSLRGAPQQDAALPLPSPRQTEPLATIPAEEHASWEPVAVVTPRETPLVPPREIVNSLGMKFVLIPAGSFTMGADDPPEIVQRDFPEIHVAFENEYPPHQVTISTPFYLSIYEVTQAEFERVMGVNPSYHSATGTGKDKVAGTDTDRFPVERVNWFDAVEFCRVLSNLPEERAVQAVYRLPTEAEWEYACRAGSQGRYSFPEDQLDRYVWHQGNAAGVPHPVGELLPNGWGLYDMQGNVWEWTADWFVKDFYLDSPAVDPRPTTPYRDLRTLRGGCYQNHPQKGSLRASYREWRPEPWPTSHTGFRIVCDLTPPAE